MRAWTALAVAGAVVAVVFALLVTHRDPRALATNGILPETFVATIPAGGGTLCQEGEGVPAGAANLRMTIGTYGDPRPPLDAKLTIGDRVVGRGHLARGSEKGAVTVPLTDVRRDGAAGATLCITSTTRLALAGQPGRTPLAVTEGVGQPGRVSVVYLSTPKSLAGLASEIVARYGRGNAGWLGGWTWWLMAVLLVAAVTVAALTVAAAAGPAAASPVRVARLAALVAALMGTIWALLIPPFHVPDEVAHVGYVQYLAETGKLPVASGSEPYSSQERALLAGVRFYDVIGRPDERVLSTRAQERDLREVEADRRTPRDDGRNTDTASANPPLYYLLEAPVYRLTPAQSLLGKLLPMRLLSVLLGAITVLAATLFVRELLPSSPWTWAAGGLVLAFQPVFGFVTAGVNADALLFACSAVTFLLCARAMRGGLTVRRAVALGAVVAAGVLTKPLFLALILPAALAVLVAAWRTPAESLGQRLRPMAVAAAIAALPVVLYQVAGSAAFDHGYFAAGTTATSLTGVGGGGGTISPGRETFSFLWQLFLPRAPWLNDLFPGDLPLRVLWLNGFLGRFGWLDYGFSDGVYVWGQRVAAAVAVAAVVGLVRNRRAVRGRLVELGVYVAAVGSVLLVVGVQDIRGRNSGTAFEQARYLFPLLALYAGLVAVAVRAAGRRVGPHVTVAVMTLAVLHTLAALALTVVRYYA